MWTIILILLGLALVWVIKEVAIPVCNNNYPEEFLREYANDMDWKEVSRNSRLSEKFIREMEDWVDWEMVFKYQDLSEEFKNEFKHKLQ